MTGEEARVAFLEWLGEERRAAPLTVEAYGADIAGFLGFLTQHLGGEPDLAALAALRQADHARLAGGARPRRARAMRRGRGICRRCAASSGSWRGGMGWTIRRCG